MNDRPVKRCPSCGERFTLREIIESPEIQPRGMAFEDDGLGYSLFYFDHCSQGCGTTFTVPVEQFSELIKEPIPAQTVAGVPQCTRECMNISDLSSCNQQCRYAPFRRFLLSTLSASS